MKSEILFEEAQKYIPGGVNSPVRAFKAVNGCPIFITKAEGSNISDVDGNSYTDYVGSWGPMILGHNKSEIIEAVSKTIGNGLSFGAATENELIMAKLICEMIPSVDMVRMVNSGTEAVMSAIRAARGYTGRDKIIKFEGGYHGHSDAMLVKAGSGIMTAGIPDSLGVPKGCANDTLTAIYNDIESVETLFEENKGEIAAIIIEPVAANMGVVLPKENFLKKLRVMCDDNGCLLIFDEVITGFRLSLQGAQGFYNVQPDLTTFGKIIGAGMPVGAYGGKREVMEMIAPLGNIYQAGTLSGNPVAMAAGIAQLTILKNKPEIYENINKLGNLLFDGLNELIKKYEVDCVINNVGSLGSIFFTNENVTNYSTAKKSDIAKFAEYFKFMIDKGLYIAPSQFEAVFISNAHTKKDVTYYLACVKEFFELQDVKCNR